jgi:hypothetical protein
VALGFGFVNVFELLQNLLWRRDKWRCCMMQGACFPVKEKQLKIPVCSSVEEFVQEIFLMNYFCAGNILKNLILCGKYS